MNILLINYIFQEEPSFHSGPSSESLQNVPPSLESYENSTHFDDPHIHPETSREFEFKVPHESSNVHENSAHFHPTSCSRHTAPARPSALSRPAVDPAPDVRLEDPAPPLRIEAHRPQPRESPPPERQSERALYDVARRIEKPDDWVGKSFYKCFFYFVKIHCKSWYLSRVLK